jgi:iron complex outermembrane receptor protein
VDYNDTYAQGIFSHKIGLNYFLDERFMFFGGVSPGDTPVVDRRIHAVSILEYLKYDPEYVTSYKHGLKSTSIQNRLRFNASAFIAKYKKYQAEVWRRLSNGLANIVFTNAGKATLQGFEAEVSALPRKNLTNELYMQGKSFLFLGLPYVYYGIGRTL